MVGMLDISEQLFVAGWQQPASRAAQWQLQHPSASVSSLLLGLLISIASAALPAPV